MKNRTETFTEISSVVTRWHRYRVDLHYADGRIEQRFFTDAETANAYGREWRAAYGAEVARWTVSIAKLEQDRVADAVRQRDAFRRAGYEWPSGRKLRQ